VDKAVKATKAFLIAKGDERHGLRNEYRDSLGPMIHELIRAFGSEGNGFNELGPWPGLFEINKTNLQKSTADKLRWNKIKEDALVDETGKQIDRWERYDKYVGPVLQDIDQYAFLGQSRFYPFLRDERRLDQLKKLRALCDKLNDAVGTSDNALADYKEKPLVDIVIDDSKDGDEKNVPFIRPLQSTENAELEATQKKTAERVRQAMEELAKDWNEWLRVAK
jgi:hypothetical protein